MKKKLVDKKISNFRRLKQIKETTTLSALDKDVTYKKFTYHLWAHHEFNKIFKHHNVVLTPQNKFSIKNLLNSNLKDNIPPEKKSGIYQIICKDCEEIYLGKTKRDLETRIKEHFRNIKISSSSPHIQWILNQSY